MTEMTKCPCGRMVSTKDAEALMMMLEIAIGKADDKEGEE